MRSLISLSVMLFIKLLIPKKKNLRKTTFNIKSPQK